MNPACDIHIGDAWRAVNLHAHSTASDGQKTPEAIAEFAERADIYVAITDHNTVDAHRLLRHGRILTGVEVTAGKAGVDVLVYGEREELISWFDARIAPHLDAHNPTMRPARREVVDVVEDALSAGLHIVIPHYAIPDGVSFLHREEQDRIGRLPVVVELNGQVSAKRNAKAAAYARAFGRPLIAADDTHWGDYGRTLTRVPLARDAGVSITSLFACINGDPGSCLFQIREPTRHEQARMVYNALRNVGLGTMAGNAAEKTAYRIDRTLSERGLQPVLIPAFAPVAEKAWKRR